jgi:hypothetical protein
MKELFVCHECYSWLVHMDPAAPRPLEEWQWMLERRTELLDLKTKLLVMRKQNKEANKVQREVQRLARRHADITTDIHAGR